MWHQIIHHEKTSLDNEPGRSPKSKSCSAVFSDAAIKLFYNGWGILLLINKSQTQQKWQEITWISCYLKALYQLQKLFRVKWGNEMAICIDWNCWGEGCRDLYQLINQEFVLVWISCVPAEVWTTYSNISCVIAWRVVWLFSDVSSVV